MSFAATITVPVTPTTMPTAITELLVQDGFMKKDLRVPEFNSDMFRELRVAAKHFAYETKGSDAWPAQSVKWLNRISTEITGKIFMELTPMQRQAIVRVARTLAKNPA